MENLLYWLLWVFAIAVASLLALLVAATREVKRLRAASQEFFKAKSAGSESNDELAALRQQLQASRAAIERMRGEIQALRAESNSRIQNVATSQGQSALEFGPASTRSKNPIALETKTYIRKKMYPKPRRAYLSTVIFLLGALAAALYYVEIRAGKVELPEPARPKLAELDSSVPGITEAPALTEAALALPAQSSGGAAVPAPSGKSAAAIVVPPVPEKAIEKPASRPAASVRPTSPAGTPYQVIRSTRVFSEPNDRSAPLARIEAGMEVTVIGVHQGWLEVRSRHGRPSGFIKSEAAVTAAIQ